jgi:hypothetical protein
MTRWFPPCPDAWGQGINPALPVFPEALDRIQRGAVVRPPDQHDVLRYRDALRHMRLDLDQEHNVEPVGLVLVKLPQKDGEAGGIAARSLPPESLPGRGATVAESQAYAYRGATT